ncbi:DUF3426 domain-containing protein [Marinobacterium marinum]|uniref:DUF3426 domain-containing protein n=1 Tax=Marinobacterium marinum TaxID=2756129 RepID=UPI002104F12D|nr:DUF3426 domain-containing protein [Marinobacterium marinum]
MVITRCPDCHARFRVTAGQLKLARGQVRCGACLCVFDARLHALPEAERVEPADTRIPPPPVNKPAAEQTGTPTPVTQSDSSPVTEISADPATNTVSAPPLSTAAATGNAIPLGPRASRDAAASASTPTGVPALDTLRLRAGSGDITRPTPDRDGNPVATTGWLLLSLVAALALTAQLLWFERAHLAQYAELKSLYALLCEQVDCSLQQNALALINNQGLHLQPHPQYADALSATILLENRAAFSQPWPGLQLRFTDLKGRLVAQRTFQPEEYLDTRSVDRMRMPTGQPMQIELELASPGRRGVSYELKLTPAAPPATR